MRVDHFYITSQSEIDDDVAKEKFSLEPEMKPGDPGLKPEYAFH